MTEETILCSGQGSKSLQASSINPPAQKPAAYRPPHAKKADAVQAEVYVSNLCICVSHISMDALLMVGISSMNHIHRGLDRMLMILYGSNLPTPTPKKDKKQKTAPSCRLLGISIIMLNNSYHQYFALRSELNCMTNFIHWIYIVRIEVTCTGEHVPKKL